MEGKEKRVTERLIKDRIIRNIRALFEPKEKRYNYEHKTVSNFLNQKYIESKSNGGRNRKF